MCLGVAKQSGHVTSPNITPWMWPYFGIFDSRSFNF